MEYINMSMDKETQKPFKLLGENLKSLRQNRNESLAEVSGAVEIEPELLENIEQGSERPSEDILLLLISHFSSKENEAAHLWQLAGYERLDHAEQNLQLSGEQYIPQPAMMILPMDARIVYTDTVHVIANKHGVVMNFLQNAGPNSQTLAVARVGMSREYANTVLEVLQKTLAQSEPKALTAPESKEPEPKKRTK